MLRLRSHSSETLAAEPLGGKWERLASAVPLAASSRLIQVDLLRGLAMALMALDHTRHFFYEQTFAPTDLAHTTAPLFLTRWSTHFCAPVFVFLAGTGAFLLARKKGKRPAGRFLLLRGIFLIGLELFFFRFLWLGVSDVRHVVAVQVLWVLGWSMILLAGLLFLPAWAVATFGVVMIACHNLLDPLDGSGAGGWDCLWGLLHHPGQYECLPGLSVLVWYPLIPWIGVMAAGYGFARLLLLEQRVRRRWLLVLGLGLTVAFVVLRAVNGYGDPQPWSRQESGLFTVLSFVNAEKSPPSLLFLLMTLGPSILLLAVADQGGRDVLTRSLVTIGRTPLFFYLLHLPLIKVLQKSGVVLAGYLGQARESLATPDDRYGLLVVYLVWPVVVVLLLPACRGLANLKAQRRSAWLSYV
jgi:uncharacterized membrane protein